MYNEFKLSPLEKKNILNDVKALTSQNSFEISYYDEGTFQPGIGGGTSSASWSDYKFYPSVIQEIDEFKSKRYDYGDSIEGDLILLLPFDTELPKDSNKYKFIYNEITFETKSIQQEQLLDGTVTHYYLIGKR